MTRNYYITLIQLYDNHARRSWRPNLVKWSTPPSKWTNYSQPYTEAYGDSISFPTDRHTSHSKTHTKALSGCTITVLDYDYDNSWPLTFWPLTHPFEVDHSFRQGCWVFPPDTLSHQTVVWVVVDWHPCTFLSLGVRALCMRSQNIYSFSCSFVRSQILSFLPSYFFSSSFRPLFFHNIYPL